MTGFTAFDWFMGAVYHTDIHASLLSDITQDFYPRLATEPYSQAPVIASLTDVLSEQYSGEIEDQEEAFASLIRRDLASVLAACSDPNVVTVLGFRDNHEKFFRDFVSRASEAARGMGLPLKNVPELFFVESFPPPYHESSASIRAFDAGDREAFGVEEGLYLGPGMRPIYSEFILCHELVHVSLGERNPDLYCTRLEEGIAEVVGAGLIALQLFSEDMVQRLFVLNRLSRVSSLKWERYLEATRQVWAYVESVGLQRLIDTVRQGRGAIRELEDEMLQGGIVREASGSRSVDDVPIALRSLFTEVCSTNPRSLVASPAAVLAAPYLAPGTSIFEAATASGLSRALVRDAAKELQDELGLLALRPDEVVVTFSEADRVAASGRLRYLSPGGES